MNVLLEIHDDAELMFPLRGLPTIDFTRGWDSGLEKLREQLAKIESPSGKLRTLDEKLRRRRRDLRKATGAEQRRLEQEIANMEQQVADQRQLADRQAASVRHTWERAEHSLAEARASTAPPSQGPGVRYVNPMPTAIQPWFVDRANEMEALHRHLANADVHLVVVSGPEGTGKSRLVCHALGSIDTGRTSVTAAVVYLSATGSRPVTASVLFADLTRLLSSETKASLAPLLAHPDVTTLQKLDAVITQLAGTDVVVIVDDAEQLTDTATGKLRDAELDEALRSLLVRRDHRVTVVLVTRTTPWDLLRMVPGRGVELRLGARLPQEETRVLLRGMDPEDSFGLGTAPDGLLDRVHALTQGHPRTLEMVFANLAIAGPRHMSLERLVEAMVKVPSSEMLDFLIDEAHRQLDPATQRALQALAVYGRPVPPAAIDDLLAPYDQGRDSHASLQRLLDLSLVRRDADGFSLPAMDQARVLRGIPVGTAADRDRDPPPFTQTALLRQAADHYRHTRQDEPRSLDDLAPQIAEIDLLIRGQEHAAALRLIDALDREYLSRWGYSHALVPQRKTLEGHLKIPWLELVNLASLGGADEQSGRYHAAIERYHKALALARRLNRADSQKKLYANLGGAYLAMGWQQRALECYQLALAISREHGSRAEEATPLIGLAVCYAMSGRFSDALQYGQEALDIVREVENTRLECEIHLRVGSWYGILGEVPAALRRLREGHDLAHRLWDRPTEGRLLDATAEILIDQGRIARATALTERAVRIGQEIGNPPLLRAANTTLALVHLCADDLEAARTAIDTAIRFRHPSEGFGLLALHGLTALRQGDRLTAEVSFATLLGEAHALQSSSGDFWSFSVLDAEAFAHCGRFLLEEEGNLDAAVNAFHGARSLTAEPGVVARIVRMLCELEEVGSPGCLDAALDAATGYPA